MVLFDRFRAMPEEERRAAFVALHRALADRGHWGDLGRITCQSAAQAAPLTVWLLAGRLYEIWTGEA